MASVGALLAACGGSGGSSASPAETQSPPQTVAPPPTSVPLLDSVPATGVTVDPRTRAVTAAHVLTTGQTFTYTGDCQPSGVALRRTLFDLSEPADDRELVDHQLRCDMAANESYRLTIDAGSGSRRQRSELAFGTGNEQGDLQAIVQDELVTSIVDVNDSFDRYVATALLAEIDSQALAAVAELAVRRIARRSWSELTGAHARYDVVAQRVSYVSRSPDGERADTLSGLVAFPQIAAAADFQPRDRVVVLSHATGSTPSSLSERDTWFVLARLFAGRGYLVIAPDNWGRGASTDATETYLLANRVANNSLDMVRAILASPDYRAFHAEQAAAPVTLLGYSQGGHSAMALWLASQARGAALDVREVYSGGAPHDLYRTVRGALQHLNGSCDDSPWCRDVDAEVIMPYLGERILPALLQYTNVGLTLGDVVVDDALKSDFVTGMLSDDAKYDALKTLLQLNSFTNLTNLAQVLDADTRVHLYHSPFDQLVPEENTRQLANMLAANFDVAFYEDECSSDEYEAFAELVNRVGAVHAVCALEMLDEAMQTMRAR